MDASRDPRLAWRKSSRSGTGTNNGNCVEVAFVGSVVAVRDSKNPDDAPLTFSPQSWSRFLARLAR